MMVRSEAFRGRFRDSYRDPKPFTPGQPTRVTVPLQDVVGRVRQVWFSWGEGGVRWSRLGRVVR